MAGCSSEQVSGRRLRLTSGSGNDYPRGSAVDSDFLFSLVCSSGRWRDISSDPPHKFLQLGHSSLSGPPNSFVPAPFSALRRSDLIHFSFAPISTPIPPFYFDDATPPIRPLLPVCSHFETPHVVFLVVAPDGSPSTRWFLSNVPPSSQEHSPGA